MVISGFFGLLLQLDLGVYESAVVAGSVGQLGLPAHGAGDDHRCLERMMRSTGTGPGLGGFLNWKHTMTRRVGNSALTGHKKERPDLQMPSAGLRNPYYAQPRVFGRPRR